MTKTTKFLKLSNGNTKVKTNAKYQIIFPQSSYGERDFTKYHVQHPDPGC